MALRGPERPFLLDVSRLVWRVWRGKLPTGIDRVCQAYVQHFGGRSRAVVQRGGFHLVLPPADSDRLFQVLLEPGGKRRGKLFRAAARGWLGTIRTPPRAGSLYLNVGHTGLNEASLPDWVARHRLRAVYLIHDLIPLTHPQFCRPGESDKHARRMNNVLDSAAGVIGNSQATLDDLTEFADRQGKPMPPSVVALLSGGDFPRGGTALHVSRPHFVTVGTIEGRKNHQLLLDVWQRLAAEHGLDSPTLLILGQRGWQAEQVIGKLDELGQLGTHVRELGNCGDKQLAGWIEGARALLMPSFIEGFGLPVIEALELGTPVIASDLPVFRELAGDVPTYLDATDAEGWRKAIIAYCSESPERKRQMTAMAGFHGPTWEVHFKKVEAWLETL